MNLLQETKKKLAEHGRVLDDVDWFGTREFILKGDIESLFNLDYDDGYGGAQIPLSLIVVGANFWLERHEYDGSEWWEFKEMPPLPFKVVDRVLTITRF